MFIFSLINILVRSSKKNKNKKQTSDKYTRFQKSVLLFQLSQKITISKGVLYISENYNQQSRSLHRPTPSQGKNRKKGKEKRKEKEKRKRKEKEKMKEMEKEKRKEKDKRGEERYNGGSGT